MPRPGRTVDVALVEVMIDGRAQLRAAADAAVQQTSLEDVWGGRAPSQRVTRPCGLCGHFQNVTIPFLRRACSHCSATWMPARCTSCATTVIAAVRENDAIFRGTCTCGGELQGLAAIPRQQIPRTTADVVAQAAHARITRRNRHVKAQMVGLVLAALAGCGLVFLLHAESTPAAGPAPAASEAGGAHQPVDLTTSAGRGTAAGSRIRANGGEINVFSCQAAYLDDLNAAAAAARPVAAPLTAPNPGITTGTNANGTAITITPRASSPVAGTNPGTAGIAPVAAPTPAATDRAYLSACLAA